MLFFFVLSKLVDEENLNILHRNPLSTSAWLHRGANVGCIVILLCVPDAWAVSGPAVLCEQDNCLL